MAFVKLISTANTLKGLKRELEEEKTDAIKIYQKEAPTRRFRHIFIDIRLFFKRVFKTLIHCFCCRKFCFKLQHYGSIENFILKSIVGFLGGLLLTYIFFLFSVFQLNFKITSATVFCAVLGCILMIGLSFSTKVRCIVLLTLPQFFSEKGRQALLAYAFVLAISGPAKNTLNNMGILSESLACGQEQLKNAVRQIIDVIKKPFYAIKDAIKKVIKTVKEVIKKIKEILLKIKKIIMAIVRVIKACFQFLAKIINICNKELGTPFERCTRIFENAILDCNAKLGPMFNWLCSIAYIVQAVCYIVKPFDLVCMIVDFISNSIIGVVIRKVKQFIRHIKTMFYVRIRFSHSFHFQTNSSKSIAEISEGIIGEIKDRTKVLQDIFQFLSSAASLFFMFIIFKVVYYRYKFLTSEKFDNKYITNDFHEIDLKRAKLGKETVLPLNNREVKVYIQMNSSKLVKTEQKALSKAMSTLFSATLKIALYMASDYCLYWVMNLIKYYGRFQSKVQAPNMPSAHISGKGFLADLLRSIVKAFQPAGIQLQIDTVPCLPTPIPPDYDRYVQIGTCLFLCWMLTFLEPYGLRFRHKIMSYYHPHRARQRSIWLYNHIMRSRSSFLKFARRQLQRILFGSKGIEKVTCKEYLAANFKLLAICLDKPQLVCLVCGEVFRESDNKKPIKCQTPGCIGVYCKECFADIQNLCTICLSPIDYGDISDVDDEIDSSEEELKPKEKKVKECKWSRRAREGKKEVSLEEQKETQNKWRWLCRRDKKQNDIEISSDDDLQSEVATTKDKKKWKWPCKPTKKLSDREISSEEEFQSEGSVKEKSTRKWKLPCKRIQRTRSEKILKVVDLDGTTTTEDDSEEELKRKKSIKEKDKSYKNWKIWRWLCKAKEEGDDASIVSYEKEEDETTKLLKERKVTLPIDDKDDIVDKKTTPDSDYYSTDASTEYSYSYQHAEKDIEPVPSISLSFKDIEKQEIPDYASLESFREESKVIEPVESPLKLSKDIENEEIPDYKSIESFRKGLKIVETVESPIKSFKSVEKQEIPDYASLKSFKQESKLIEPAESPLKLSKDSEKQEIPDYASLERFREKLKMIKTVESPIKSTETSISGTTFQQTKEDKHVDFTDTPTTEEEKVIKMHEKKPEEIPLVDPSICICSDSDEMNLTIEIPNNESTLITIPENTVSSTTPYDDLELLQDTATPFDMCTCDMPKSKRFSDVEYKEVSEYTPSTFSSRNLSSSSYISSSPEKNTPTSKKGKKEDLGLDTTQQTYMVECNFNPEQKLRQRRKVQKYYKTINKIPMEKVEVTRKPSKLKSLVKKITGKTKNLGELPFYETDEAELKSYRYQSRQLIPPKCKCNQNQETTLVTPTSSKAESGSKRQRGGGQIPEDSSYLSILKSKYSAVFPNLSEQKSINDRELLARYFLNIEDLTPTRDPGLQMTKEVIELETFNSNLKTENYKNKPTTLKRNIKFKIESKSYHDNLELKSSSSVLSTEFCENILGTSFVPRKDRNKQKTETSLYPNIGNTQPVSNSGKETGSLQKNFSRNFKQVDFTCNTAFVPTTAVFLSSLEDTNPNAEEVGRLFSKSKAPQVENNNAENDSRSSQTNNDPPRYRSQDRQSFDLSNRSKGSPRHSYQYSEHPYTSESNQQPRKNSGSIESQDIAQQTSHPTILKTPSPTYSKRSSEDRSNESSNRNSDSIGSPNKIRSPTYSKRSSEDRSNESSNRNSDSINSPNKTPSPTDSKRSSEERSNESSNRTLESIGSPKKSPSPIYSKRSSEDKTYERYPSSPAYNKKSSEISAQYFENPNRAAIESQNRNRQTSFPRILEAPSPTDSISSENNSNEAVRPSVDVKERTRQSVYCKLRNRSRMECKAPCAFKEKPERDISHMVGDPIPHKITMSDKILQTSDNNLLQRRSDCYCKPPCQISSDAVDTGINTPRSESIQTQIATSSDDRYFIPETPSAGSPVCSCCCCRQKYEKNIRKCPSEKSLMPSKPPSPRRYRICPRDKQYVCECDCKCDERRHDYARKYQPRPYAEIPRPRFQRDEIICCQGDCRCRNIRKPKPYPPPPPPLYKYHTRQYNNSSDEESVKSFEGEEDEGSYYSDDSREGYDLPYQNNSEYLDLVHELEETLQNRSRSRVKRAMREFEHRSRYNKPLDRPIIKYDETSESEEPLIQKISEINEKRKCCGTGKECTCKRPKEFQQQIYPKPKPRKRSKSPNPRKPNKGLPKTRWQIDSKSGEWFKVSDLYTKRGGMSSRTPSPQKDYCSQDCNCCNKKYR